MSDRRKVLKAELNSPLMIINYGQIGAGKPVTTAPSNGKSLDLYHAPTDGGMIVAFQGKEILVPFSNIKSVELAPKETKEA